MINKYDFPAGAKPCAKCGVEAAVYMDGWLTCLNCGAQPVWNAVLKAENVEVLAWHRREKAAQLRKDK